MAHSSKSYLVSLSLAALAFFGLGPQEPAKEQITMKLNPKVGERFETSASVVSRSDETTTVEAKMIMADRILELRSDRFIARRFISEAKMRGTGSAAQLPFASAPAKVPPTILEITLQGLVVSVDEVSSPRPQSFGVILPPKSVSVGDTWTENQKLSQNGPEIPMLYKLESFSETEATISATPSETPGYKFDKPFKFIVHRPSGRTITGEGQFTFYFAGAAVETKMKSQLTSPDYRKKTNGPQS